MLEQKFRSLRPAWSCRNPCCAAYGLPRERKIFGELKKEMRLVRHTFILISFLVAAGMLACDSPPASVVTPTPELSESLQSPQPPAQAAVERTKSLNNEQVPTHNVGANISACTHWDDGAHACIVQSAPSTGYCDNSTHPYTTAYSDSNSDHHAGPYSGGRSHANSHGHACTQSIACC